MLSSVAARPVGPPFPSGSESHPEGPVGLAESRPGALVLQSGHLLPKREVFEGEIRPGPEECPDDVDLEFHDEHEETEHGR